MKTKTQSIEDYDLDLDFEPAAYCATFVREVGDKLVVGYLAPDTKRQKLRG